MKLTQFDTVILAAAFFSMVFSIVMWFLNAQDLTAVFVGLWVPSILGLGIFLKLKDLEGKK
ncbi:MAG: hypothetical protein OEV74_14475 [Cyclobacteriaceae bacterium]|nr:hypothetical protein [Cyclobacteriaceae bacterium]MDH4297487.1 hypothetical protein [Cyclobacteriaceae bacterium]MDH5249688.1 hypothetical protein [Cyclobacteriaceae bacterium]